MKYYSFVFLTILVSALFVAACNPELKAQKDLALQQNILQPNISKLYNYDKVHTYTYRMITNTSDKPIINYFRQTVRQEKINETPSYLIESYLETEGIVLPSDINASTKIWFSKDDERCLQAYSELHNQGNITRTANTCGASMIIGNIPTSSFMNYGREMTTVPAGTFETDLIGLNGSIMYYIAKDVPVPVKQVWGSGEESKGKITYELTEWS